MGSPSNPLTIPDLSDGPANEDSFLFTRTENRWRSDDIDTTCNPLWRLRYATLAGVAFDVSKATPAIDRRANDAAGDRTAFAGQG